MFGGLLALVAPLLTAPLAVQEVKLIGQSITGQDRFGEALAVVGKSAVVGAHDDDASVLDGGAAYVFVESGGVWSQEALLLASDGATNDAFGWSVAISADTVVVGAPNADITGLANAGAAYVFTRTGSVWTQQAKLLAPAAEIGLSDKFGAAVAMQDDLLVAGAPLKDASGINGVGAAFVFSRAGTTWSEGTMLVPSQLSLFHGFGDAVAVREGAVLVGAPATFAAATDPGAAYVFVGMGASWTERAALSASDGQAGDRFGVSVSLTDGRALVGAEAHAVGGLVGAGSAYVFERSGTSWNETSQLTASDAAAADGFGGSVSLGGATALVGARGVDHGAWTDAGSAYLFAERGGVWTEEQQLTASDADDFDGFGAAVGLEGATALAGAPLDSLGIENADSVLGLAHDPAGALFGVESLNGQLLAIEPFPGGYVVGDVGYDNLQALAFDSLAGVFYGTDISSDRLIRIDATTGLGVEVGALGFDQVRGLAFDPSTATLYATDVQTDQLLVVDTASGAATPVGNMGYKAVQGLAFDAAAGTLYGADVSLDVLITIDTATGAGTPVGPVGSLGFGKVQGLSFDPIARVLYGTDDGDELVVIDPLSGIATTLGPTYVSQGGSAYAFELDLTETYCSAGTSAGGCRASIGAVGAASASSSTGFTLSASGVEGAKQGLFFFGVNGRQANRWGNGSSLQCVVPPVKRGGLLPAAGTSGQCDGWFAQDLNALWCSSCAKPAKNPGSGVLMQAQLWYRDPFGTSNQTTGLSDAVEFLVGP
jgi:hypothetical protein